MGSLTMPSPLGAAKRSPAASFLPQRWAAMQEEPMPNRMPGSLPLSSPACNHTGWGPGVTSSSLMCPCHLCHLCLLQGPAAGRPACCGRCCLQGHPGSAHTLEMSASVCALRGVPGLLSGPQFYHAYSEMN